jgi:hypothetical protein
LKGKIKIVLIEGVLGIKTASDHASAAKIAPGPFGPFSIEIGIRHFLIGFTEKYGDICRFKQIPFPDLMGQLLKSDITGFEPWISCSAEHIQSRFIVGF